jgi:hypothetical protein
VLLLPLLIQESCVDLLFHVHDAPSQARVASVNLGASANFNRAESAWLSLRGKEKDMQSVVRRWQMETRSSQ